MKEICVLALLVFLLQPGQSIAQTPSVKVAGKVYFKYSSKAAQTEQTSTYQQYASDFKVILVESQFTGDATEIMRRKYKFCANDRETIDRFRARIFYTDMNGNYEFKNLKRQTTYFVIFCDKKIQISEITTKSRVITYKLKDKLVYL